MLLQRKKKIKSNWVALLWTVFLRNISLGLTVSNRLEHPGYTFYQDHKII